MGLTIEQETAFNDLQITHFDKMKTIHEAINKKRKEFREESLRVDADPAKIVQIASEISNLHYEFEINMHSHFTEVRKILNKDQIKIFNKLLEKSMMRRNPTHFPPRHLRKQVFNKI